MSLPPINTPIRVVEVGPRDGLQNEKNFVATQSKRQFIHDLAASGLQEIEITSFVSPKWVPQLADAAQLAQEFAQQPLERTKYSVLVPNLKGLERAIEVGCRRVAVFTAASDMFTRRNINCTVSESIERFRPVVFSAKRDGMMVRGYISTVTHCPFEGTVQPSQVLDVIRMLLDLGVDEISLGDTVGKASPRDIRKLLDEIVPRIDRSRLSLHVHDTCGMAVANVLTAWTEYGIEMFDTSAGGLGGCPYAPGASGNVATEDVVYALRASGALLTVDERKVVAAASKIGEALNRRLSSRLSQVQIEQTAYEGAA